jgi:ABC-type branched-subunit amino acid transport system substrate-binding protein
MRTRAFLAMLALCFSTQSFGETAPGENQPAPIKVGRSMVMSGPQAPNGMLLYQGAKVHLDVVNANGGIHGRPIEVITLDDAYNPERSKENTRELLEQGVEVLFGYTGTGPTAASAPLAAEAGVAMLAPVSGAVELRGEGFEHVFYTRASYYDEISAMVKHLTASGINSKIGVVYQDDGFGNAALKIVRQVLAEQKLPEPVAAPLAKQTYEATAAVAALSAAAPDAIIMATSGDASVNFIREYNKTGRYTLFLGLSVVSGNKLVQELGTEADGVIITQVVPSPWAQKSQIVREFHQDLSAIPENANIEINYSTLEGYIAARVLVEALRRAGPDVTPAKVRSALENMRNLSLGGFDINFGHGNNTGSTYTDLSMLRSTGRYIQ